MEKNDELSAAVLSVAPGVEMEAFSDVFTDTTKIRLSFATAAAFELTDEIVAREDLDSLAERLQGALRRIRDNALHGLGMQHLIDDAVESARADVKREKVALLDRVRDDLRLLLAGTLDTVQWTAIGGLIGDMQREL